MANVLIVTNIGKFRMPPPMILARFDAVVGINRCETIETGLSSIFFGCWHAAFNDSDFWRRRVDHLRDVPFIGIPTAEGLRRYCRQAGRADLAQTLKIQDYPQPLLKMSYGWTTAGRAALYHADRGDSVTVWGSEHADKRAGWESYISYTEQRLLRQLKINFIGQEDFA